VNTWFRDKRRKLIKDHAITEDEMLLAREGLESSGHPEDPEEDDMLLSQATDNTPSLIPLSFCPSVPWSQNREVSLKRSLQGDEAILLDKSSTCELGEAAVHILISGYISRGLRGLGGIHVKKPPPSLSLAGIAPSVFCPGFKEVRSLSRFSCPF
jgi:hypothetical protein